MVAGLLQAIWSASVYMWSNVGVMICTQRRPSIRVPPSKAGWPVEGGGRGTGAETSALAELDAVSRQILPHRHPKARADCVCTAAPVWCGLDCSFHTVMVRKPAAYKRPGSH